MAFPQDPQDLIVEAHLGGDWVDLVTPGYVRDAQGITIERGLSAEGGSATPSTCSLTLNNRGGHFTPRNPAGAYFGQLGRNTPLRVALGLTEDDFDRTVASGWGTSADGIQWLTTGIGTGSAAVGSGAATHVQSTTTGYRLTYQGAVTYGTVDVAVTVSLAGVSNVTGGNLEPANLVLRATGVSDYTFVRLVIDTAEAVTISIHNFDTGQLVAPVTVTGLTHTAAQALRVRAVAEGSTVRAKVWAADQPEPADWHVSAVDPDMAATGWVGVRSGVAGGNTNIPVSMAYDDWAVRSPRWAGEVSEWPVESDTSGEDVTTSITGSGLLRRLGQGRAPLRSVMYRAQLAPSRSTPVAYWPMEDGRDATEFGSAVGGPSMALVGAITPASDDSTFAASAALPSFGTGIARGAVPSYTTTGTMVLYLLVSVPSGGVPAERRLATVNVTGSRVSYWSILLDTAGDLRVIAFDSADTIIDDSGYFGFGINGSPRLFRLLWTQDGSDVDYTLATANIGSGLVSGMSDTVTGASLGRATTITLNPAGNDMGGVIMGHVALKSVEDYSLWDVATQAHAGESAGDRLVRLCEEEDLPLVVHGDPADTEPMGAQTARTILDLIEECAQVDGGMLVEPAGSIGIAYRTRVSLYSQAAAVTIDQTTGQVQPPLVPVDDDRYVRNQVTVSRESGASATHARETGPLSVSEPPEGVGRYDDAITLNVATDSQLADQAAWRVHLGTIDQPRYPAVAVNLAKTTALRNDVLAAGIGDRLVITHNKPGRYGQGDIDGLIQGYVEFLSRFEHTITWTTSPATAYAVGVYAEDTGDTGEHVMRYDADDSELASGVAAGATSMSVQTNSGPLWTTIADDCPMEVDVGGIQVTVTAISGASSPQTFTIEAAPYALEAGAAVSVVSPVYGL
ncbi:hypothetical protein [Actinokineospora sp. UTMC 2448]|uniref:hypothetical protein n=1 Tax=Actinokineospora sp. UTMC 2448 TaxID=2268449 RepID=UPI002164B249|nr:hypothetical protein [Actinokineospora sp. UTMC 2448]UVS81851.1 hypothetical protein Actkin_05615 [Actinokineospora sp. UTMC 2448]